MKFNTHTNMKIILVLTLALLQLFQGKISRQVKSASNASGGNNQPKTETTSVASLISKYVDSIKKPQFDFYKNIEEKGTCSEEQSDTIINYDLIPKIGIDFKAILKALLAAKPSSDKFKICYGLYKGQDIYSQIINEVPTCSRLLLSQTNEYSIIAMNLKSFGCGSVCLAFDEVGTVNYSMDDSSVNCLNLMQTLGFDTKGAILLGVASVLKTRIDLGVSPERRLAKTILIPYLNKDEFVELKEIEFKSQFSFFLPENLNPLQILNKGRLLDLVPKAVIDAVDIPVEVPILADFGPNAKNRGNLINTVFGPGLDPTKLLDSLKNAELVASITGKLILRIQNVIGFPNPFVLNTKNVGILIKTGDEDFNNGFKEAGLYMSIPPEAHQDLHEFLRTNLKALKIFIPEHPSLRVGFMFTSKRFGWIIELPNNKIKWTCNLPWTIFGEPDPLANKNCALYIGTQKMNK